MPLVLLSAPHHRPQRVLCWAQMREPSPASGRHPSSPGRRRARPSAWQNSNPDLHLLQHGVRGPTCPHQADRQPLMSQSSCPRVHESVLSTTMGVEAGRSGVAASGVRHLASSLVLGLFFWSVGTA